MNCKEVVNRIGVTHKTAWRMCNKIRSLTDETATVDMSGDRPFEADEAWFGGKAELDNWKSGDKKRKKRTRKKRVSKNPRRPRGKGGASKMIVLGVKQRGGNLIHKVVPARSVKCVLGFLTRLVPAGSRIFTDGYIVYGRLKKLGYDHRVVKSKDDPNFIHHGIHTNNIEGSWTGPKAAIRGTHRSVSPKHLQGYLNLMSFHHNRREMPEADRFMDLMNRAATPPPTPAQFWED